MKQWVAKSYIAQERKRKKRKSEIAFSHRMCSPFGICAWKRRQKLSLSLHLFASHFIGRFCRSITCININIQQRRLNWVELNWTELNNNNRWHNHQGRSVSGMNLFIVPQGQLYGAACYCSSRHRFVGVSHTHTSIQVKSIKDSVAAITTTITTKTTVQRRARERS